MLVVTRSIRIPASEIDITAVRSSGAGGQNVNKVSSAIHLRFNISSSSLPPWVKQRLLALSDRRITRDGVVVIKAQRYRDREKNHADALDRLCELVRGVLATQRKRIPTRVTVGAKKRRLEQKIRRGRDKILRGKVRADD